METKINQLLLALMLLVTVSASSQLSSEQQAEVESLQKIIKSAEHDTVIINAWMDWDDIIYLNDPDLDFELNQKIDSLCKLNLDKSLNQRERYTFFNAQGFALNNIGLIYMDKGEFDKAIIKFTESISVKEKIGDQKGIAASLGNIGIIYDYEGDYYKAIDYYTRSLKIKEKIGDQKGIAGDLNNIGGIYNSLSEYDLALEYFIQSHNIKKEIGDKLGMANSLNNIGSIYEMKDDNEKAIDYFTESAKMSEEIGNIQGAANAYNNIGLIHFNEGNYSIALELFEKSLLLLEEIDDKLGRANTLNNIGRVYIEQGNYNLASNYSELSLTLAQEIGSAKEIQNAANSLWKIYKAMSRFKDALSMHELSIQMRDKIESEENQKEVYRQEYKIEYEKKAAADSVLFAKEKEISDVQIEKQSLELSAKRNQQYALIGGLFLFALFGFIMYNRFKETRRQKIVIEETHEQLEEKNQEILDSISYAKRIQTAILPPHKLINQYLSNSFVLYKPKDIVAGDFYWLEPLEGKVLFAAADCTGHGVPGAMVSVICNNGLNRAVREYGLSDPGEILTKTRELVISEFEKSEEEVKDGMDIALCYLEGNKLKYSGANNPLWIIRKGAKELEEVKADKQPIGKYSDPKPFTSHELALEPGDTFYIFSDGFADQFGGEKGKKFKAKNFKSLLLSIQSESIDRQKELINESFENWKGKLEQLDDICIIGVKV